MGECCQFGKVLVDFQVLQFKLVDMVIQFVVVWQMVYIVVCKFDVGVSDVNVWCVMVKCFVIDVGFYVCNDVLQIYGGYGYICEYLIEWLFCDCCVYQILEGINEIMCVIVVCYLFNIEEEL